MLRILLEQRPRAVSKSELHDRVWAGTFVADASLSVVIAEIRRVLCDSKDGSLIRTAHRVGYAFCGEATDLTSPPSGGRSSPIWLNWQDRTFPLTDGSHIVGRDPRCDVWIDASGVSRRHARIVVIGEEASIEDLGSSNGTFVGGKRITAARRLADGDAIELGAATLTFRVWSDARPPKTERLKR